MTIAEENACVEALGIMEEVMWITIPTLATGSFAEVKTVVCVSEESEKMLR